MNNVALIGRLTKEPELRYLPTGTSNCSFTLAIDRNLSREKKEEAEAKGYPTADFIRIVAWGKQAENCANFLVKGRLAGIQGRIQTGSYTKDDGTRVFTTDVVAEKVQFLEWGDKQQGQDYSSGFGEMEGFTPIDDDSIPF